MTRIVCLLLSLLPVCGIADERISFVTFLLPPSRKNLGALERLGARHVGEIEYGGAKFLKFRLETE